MSTVVSFRKPAEGAQVPGKITKATLIRLIEQVIKERPDIKDLAADYNQYLVNRDLADSSQACFDWAHERLGTEFASRMKDISVF